MVNTTDRVSLNAIDITGQKFGRLTATTQLKSSHGKATWVCICDCGATKIVLSESLRRGKTKSCGCLRKEAAGKQFTTHGKTGTPEYASWQNMHSRCYNPANKAYWRYGAKGIDVCSRWKSFEKFLADMGEKPSPEYSIDRIDNSKGYYPDNCRWATATEQVRNRDITLVVNYKDATIPVVELADLLKVNYHTFLERLNKAKEKYTNA